MIPLMVEVIGEAEVGKTKFCCTAPRVLLIDTTPTKEAVPIIMKHIGSDWKRHYVWVRDWQELERAVREALESDYATIAIDTSRSLQDLAAEDWLKETGKKAVYPITQYAHVRKKVDKLLAKIVAKGINLVLTAQMKDEWVGGRSTGRRIRDGYRKASFMADIRLYLSLEKKVDKKGLPTGGYERKCRIVKNRFVDRCSDEYVHYLEDVSWKGVMDLTGLGAEELVA